MKHIQRTINSVCDLDTRKVLFSQQQNAWKYSSKEVKSYETSLELENYLKLDTNAGQRQLMSPVKGILQYHPRIAQHAC